MQILRNTRTGEVAIRVGGTAVLPGGVTKGARHVRSIAWEDAPDEVVGDEQKRVAVQIAGFQAKRAANRAAKERQIIRNVVEGLGEFEKFAAHVRGTK